MKFREYAESVKTTKSPESLEFKPAVLWLNMGRMPRGLLSIGNCDKKIIKVPGCVLVSDDDYGYSNGRREVSVIAVSRQTFAGNENVTDIILPPSVEHIPEGAFAGCKNLKNITIPKKVKTIKEGTFEGCVSLENIYYEGSMDDWKKVEVVHHRHEIEFGDFIPGSPVSRIVSERMEYIPGNEAVLTASIHFHCDFEGLGQVLYPVKGDFERETFEPEAGADESNEAGGFYLGQPNDKILEALERIRAGMKDQDKE